MLEWNVDLMLLLRTSTIHRYHYKTKQLKELRKTCFDNPPPQIIAWFFLFLLLYSCLGAGGQFPQASSPVQRSKEEKDLSMNLGYSPQEHAASLTEITYKMKEQGWSAKKKSYCSHTVNPGRNFGCVWKKFEGPPIKVANCVSNIISVYQRWFEPSSLSAWNPIT